MQEFNKIHTKEDILSAVKRNQRLNLRRVGMSPVIETVKDEWGAFLEWYVFEKLGTTPQAFIGNLETQYYSEQNFRDRRQRNVDFTRGRQFNEPVYDSELGRWVTQWTYLRRRNMPPLTYNVVSKLGRSLTGQFREINTGNIVKCDSKDDRGSDLANFLTICLNRIKSNNRSRSKDAANFQEHLHSGRPVFKVMWANKNNAGRPDIKYRNVSTDKFMVNPGIVDYDQDNLHTMCEIHDTSVNDIITLFANGNYEKGKEIERAYKNYQGDERRQATYSSQSFDGNQRRNNTFHTQGVGNSSYRYYEVWTLISDFEAITTDPLEDFGAPKLHKWEDVEKVRKEVESENLRREELAQGEIDEKEYKKTFKADFVSRWYVMNMTPWGYVLDVRESPYENGMHPYIFPAPQINGEVWGIIEEVLNAQLSMDRQILQADAIVANASKGMWLVPDTAVPDYMTNKEYIAELKKVDGAVIYKVRDGIEKHKPEQQFANSANVAGNVQQLIQLYANLVDEISGNYGAAQGRSDSSTKTATGYALESQNAGLNVRDMMENYLTVLLDRDERMLQLMLEGYDKADYKRITGVDIDPRELRKFNFTIEQSKGTNSPAHRMALEQQLLQFVFEQIVPFEVFAEVSNNPLFQQAKQKMDEYNKKVAEQQQNMMLNSPQGGSAPMAVPVADQKQMVQGHPQAGILQDAGVGQQMRRLAGV